MAAVRGLAAAAATPYSGRMSEPSAHPFPWSAWAIHLLTATGAVWAFLALLAVIDGDAQAVFLWLALALLVDGIDGPLARRFEVKARVPLFDGAALDLIVDYLTYVFVPVAFLWRFDLLPQSLDLAGCAWVLLTSLHLFAKLDMKEPDNHFLGFPAVWNVVVLYLFLLDGGPWTNAAVVLACGILTFLPVRFLHPFRVRRLRPVTVALTAGWGAAALWLVLAYPARPLFPLVLFLAASAWVAGLSLWRTVSGPWR